MNRRAIAASLAFLALAGLFLWWSRLELSGARALEHVSPEPGAGKETPSLLQPPPVELQGPVRVAAADDESGLEVADEPLGDDPRARDLAAGRIFRIEDALERPVVGATVKVYWRAGWGEYEEVEAVTDSRGEFISSLESAFQLEELSVSLPGSERSFTNVGNTCLPDPGPRGLIRHALPAEVEVLVRVTDRHGNPAPSAGVEVERQRTFPLKPGLNMLCREGETPDSPTDARGEVRLVLDEGVYEIRAAANLDGRTAVTVAGVARGAAPLVVELQLGVTAAPKRLDRSFRGTVPSPSAGSSAEADERITMEGQVIEAATRKPVQGAAVSIVSHLPKSGRGGEPATDGAGRFKVSGRVRGGRGFLFARAKGHAWAAIPVDAAHSGSSITLEMEAAQRIEGRAVDSDGAPVPGTAYLFTPRQRVGLPRASAGLNDAAGYYSSPVERLETGPPGSFHFSGATAALHRIWFRPDDPALPPAVELAQGGDLNVLVRVEGVPAGLASAHGFVRDRITGRGVPGLSVHYSGEHTQLGTSGTTDAEGKYVVHGLEPGEFLVRVEHEKESTGLEAYAFEEAVVRLAEGDNEIHLRASPARTLQLLLVKGPEGLPLRDAQVAAFRSDGLLVELQDDAGYREGDHETTDWNGRVDLMGLPAGEIELGIWEAESPPGEPNFRRLVDVSQPQTRIVTLRL